MVDLGQHEAVGGREGALREGRPREGGRETGTGECVGCCVRRRIVLRLRLCVGGGGDWSVLGPWRGVLAVQSRLCESMMLVEECELAVRVSYDLKNKSSPKNILNVSSKTNHGCRIEMN